MIPVTKPYRPSFKLLENYLQKVHANEWYTNFGPLHQELTEKLEDYLGIQNLLLVSNGTLALQIAYKALGISGKVLTTPFSFVASSSSLLWEGIEPIYTDIKKGNLGINPELLDKKFVPDVSAIVGVHVYGNPSDVEEIDSYANKKNLKVVYDGAHAFGIKKGGKSILSWGDATTLSFHATKVFHTVEGGAIVFKKKSDFVKAKELINFGMNDAKDIIHVGINSKLNEYQAAVGLTLLQEIDYIIESRQEAYRFYEEKLKDDFEVLDWPSDVNRNGAYFPVFFRSEEELLKAMKSLSEQGVQTRRYFHPSLNKIPVFNSKDECPVSENMAQRVLCLPMYTGISPEDQAKVVGLIQRCL